MHVPLNANLAPDEVLDKQVSPGLNIGPPEVQVAVLSREKQLLALKILNEERRCSITCSA